MAYHAGFVLFSSASLYGATRFTSEALTNSSYFDKKPVEEPMSIEDTILIEKILKEDEAALQKNQDCQKLKENIGNNWFYCISHHFTIY